MTAQLQTDRAATASALSDRLFDATVGTLELYSVHLGWRLHLYERLAERGPLTSAELADAAGIAERYAREWLEQQAVAGLLEADSEPASDRRRYRLSDGAGDVLVDAESPYFTAPFAPMVVGIAAALPDVADAYRTGGGVPYARYGGDFREGQAAINRPMYVNDLPGWLRSVPEIDTRLRADPPARVADLGCGLGASTLAIARSYPLAEVHGIDTDSASIDAARAEARALGRRVSFRVADASELSASGPYDLVCIFEALHDMARPVPALVAARRALAEGGSVLVADERVAAEFHAPADPIERMMYGWSVTHCLPSAMADRPSAALGTVLREDTVRDLAGAAGFAGVDVLAIENPFFRFYRLVP